MSNEEIDIDQEAESTGGIVTCAADYYDEIGELSEYFQNPKLTNAARFALAIGIQKNIRIPKAEWKKPTKKKTLRTIAHLGGTFSDGGKYDFQVLIEMLGLIEPEDIEKKTPLHSILSEYITGGMKWISEQEIHKGGNFSALKDDENFSTLFVD